jgi:uncharacterized protein (TIGR02118 family)
VINVSVRYPNRRGAHFDMTYYRTRHIPLCQERYGPALLATTVLAPVDAAQIGAPASTAAVVHFEFESFEVFTSLLAAHGHEIVADVGNFTDIAPVIEIGRIV